MGKKVFLIDVARCNGCRNCQLACKDEHCGTSWLPFAAEQPETGQFWCKIEEKVRGSVPKTRITYTPHIGGQSDELSRIGGDAVVVREDGLMYIDPEKARGRKDLCEVPGVFWNEELQIPQTCTGCAHLLDDGWTCPRCVDSCPTEALRFGDEEDFAEELKAAKQLDANSRVYYLNLPERFVAGEVYDEEADEVLIGATVKLFKGDELVAQTTTDDFGDFWFKDVKPASYVVKFEQDGYLAGETAADANEVDVNVGSIALYTA